MGIVRDIVFQNGYVVVHYVVEVDGQMYDVPAGEGYATISKTYGQNNLRNDYFEEER